MPPAVAMRPDASTLTHPPNSPTQTSKPLVDLTDNGNGGATAEAGTTKDTDADLERAIKLSLQETGTVTSFNSHFSQEDQDVSRALEASLMMEPMSGAKRKRGDTYVDSPNPHDRERNGLVS